jgi:hypothetical protein
MTMLETSVPLRSGWGPVGAVRERSAHYRTAVELMLYSGEGRTEMARNTIKRREWTKEDARMLKTLARERVKTSVIARKLRRSVGATRNKEFHLGISFKAPRTKK